MAGDFCFKITDALSDEKKKKRKRKKKSTFPLGTPLKTKVY